MMPVLSLVLRHHRLPTQQLLLLNKNQLPVAKINLRTMASFLVDEPKYGFLKDLGLAQKNLGVYNGKWMGSGEVRFSPIIHFISTNFLLTCGI